jgi:nickel-dependent lactate racemase
MIYDLKYGNEVVSFELPAAWRNQVIHHKTPLVRNIEETLLEALGNPIGSAPFEEWARGRNLLIIVSDVTRYSGAERFLPILYQKYLSNSTVKILFALGNHRKQTEEEKRRIVSDLVFENVTCVDHDCFDPAQLVSLGHTSSGLEITVNRALTETDGVVLTGSISFHYLAGFGGGRKVIFPGISGYETILGIHKMVFNRDKPGKHERAQSAILEGNPMHEEMMEALALATTPMFLINTVLDAKRNLLNVFCGDVKSAHEEGCRWYSDHFKVAGQEKADVVVVSCGGYPKDIDFIQSHKGLEHAKGAVKEGGTMILLARCQDGPGNPNFLPWFTYPTLEEMEPHVRASDKVYAQTAYSTRMKAQKYRIILVSDMDEDEVRTMGIIPKRSLEEALAECDRNSDLVCRVVPEGSKTLCQ